MTGADLERLYASAVKNVRQPHLDRLRAAGVTPATIARLGSAYPPFGVLCGEVERSNRFNAGEGKPHVIQPVVEGCGLIDLVAWRVGEPARWGLVSGLGWLLNADTCLGSRWDADKLTLHATPLDWLRADAHGGVVLDWHAPDLAWLRSFSLIECGDALLAISVRRALSKPRRLPVITVAEVRHVA
ncbi:hypothetical protein [Sphingomonas phyllosphaerae]|uniref:hypothetical protein n=1 Tax=Sphingomonas phyllosphaerae TaxID=257003 RepID=UPI0003B4B480|nr:hypothetical protein [Sphingomonas phyllosphaerae]